MGDNRQSIDVVWDTGSFIYLAETDACSACDQAEAYDTSTSPSFSDFGISYSQSYLDGTTLSGNFASDSVCVADDAASCVSGFLWISVSESQLGGNYQGILGMGQDYTYRSYLYARQLYEDGIVSENTFSFLLTDAPWTTGDSYIDFGAPNTSVMSSEDDIVWIDSTSHGGWWTNYVTGWRWANSETEYAVTRRWALTDTGSSCILGPAETVDVWR